MEISGRYGYITKSAAEFSGFEGKQAEERRAEVPAQLERLSDAVEEAHDALRTLVGRLESVLRSAGPEPASTAGAQLTAVGPSTQCGATIAANVTRLHELSGGLHDLLRRLEV